MAEMKDEFSVKPFNFDDYLKSTLGEFGKYQLFVLLVLSIPSCFLSSWASVDMVFIAYTPQHLCNNTLTENNYSWSNVNDSWMLEPKECSITYYRWNGTSNETIDEQSCSKWDYDKKYFDRTIITDWNLVCGEALVPRTIIALLNLSVLAATIYSFIQDRWGRKKAFLLNLTVFLVGSCGSLLAPNPLAFSILKLIGGISCMWEIGFCWTLEFSGPSHRTTVTTLLTVLYSVATVSITLVAYLCKTWVQIGFCTSVPFVFLYIYIFIVPESPRWLLTQGRTEEALAIMQKVAYWNNVTIDVEDLRYQLKSCRKVAGEVHSNSLSVKEFFKSSNLRWKNCFMTIIGIAANQLYYAVPYSLENLEGNFLLAFVLQAAVEAPASMLNLVFINRFGRVLPMSISLLCASLCCFMTWPFAKIGEYGAVAFAVAARFFIAGGVAIIEQVEGELYPTVARGVGSSVSYVTYALANVASQYILYTATVWNVLPLIIMGSFTLVASILCLFLPETRGLNLPDTVKEAETQGSVGLKSFISHFRCAKTVLEYSNDVLSNKNHGIGIALERF